MGFLFSRRWLLFAVTVAVLAYGCWWLGEWQFHRLADRKQDNARTERNLTLPPAPVDDVLAPGRPVAHADEWRRVRATGEYVESKSIVLRYQTRDGASGVDVVTPLQVQGSDALLLVDRGWMATDNAGTADVQAPPVPSGPVTVVGWVRADATGDSTEVTDQSTRAISSEAIGDALDAETYGGFVDLQKQSPVGARPLTTTDLPDLSNGPHFFYGLQWWFFGALAVFGFGYLAFDERRKLRRPGPGAAPAGAPAPQLETSPESGRSGR
ncbi:SURF1 family protein [Nocardioides mesophilus]|uniref:SURF1 family cytochrome oxidase biogenesis protein n=1 Tax=Nocardioides mesophilus TaxID=433659 RepID=UPI001FEB85ED|nr:SURF1 family protein [Nocardioides mesophilus]